MRSDPLLNIGDIPAFDISRTAKLSLAGFVKCHVLLSDVLFEKPNPPKPLRAGPSNTKIPQRVVCKEGTTDIIGHSFEGVGILAQVCSLTGLSQRYQRTCGSWVYWTWNVGALERSRYVKSSWIWNKNRSSIYESVGSLRSRSGETEAEREATTVKEPELESITTECPEQAPEDLPLLRQGNS